MRNIVSNKIYYTFYKEVKLCQFAERLRIQMLGKLIDSKREL